MYTCSVGELSRRSLLWYVSLLAWPARLALRLNLLPQQGKDPATFMGLIAPRVLRLIARCEHYTARTTGRCTKSSARLITVSSTSASCHRVTLLTRLPRSRSARAPHARSPRFTT